MIVAAAKQPAPVDRLVVHAGLRHRHQQPASAGRDFRRRAGIDEVTRIAPNESPLRVTLTLRQCTGGNQFDCHPGLAGSRRQFGYVLRDERMRLLLLDRPGQQDA
jgi:hypothetical protein